MYIRFYSTPYFISENLYSYYFALNRAWCSPWGFSAYHYEITNSGLMVKCLNEQSARVALARSKVEAKEIIQSGSFSADIPDTQIHPMRFLCISYPKPVLVDSDLVLLAFAIQCYRRGSWLVIWYWFGWTCCSFWNVHISPYSLFLIHWFPTFFVDLQRKILLLEYRLRPPSQPQVLNPVYSHHGWSMSSDLCQLNFYMHFSTLPVWQMVVLLVVVIIVYWT